MKKRKREEDIDADESGEERRMGEEIDGYKRRKKKEKCKREREKRRRGNRRR